MTHEQQTTVLHAPADIAAGAATYLPNGARYEAWETPVGVVVNVSTADVEAMTTHGYSANGPQTHTPSVMPQAALSPTIRVDDPAPSPAPPEAADPGAMTSVASTETPLMTTGN